MLEWLAHAVGLVGVGLIVGSYFMLQVGRLRDRSWMYSAMNLVGALLILVSLIQQFNFSAFVIEIFWAAISLLGLIRAIRTNPGSVDESLVR